MKDIDLGNLDFSNIGSWPAAIKVALIILVCTGVAAGGYFLFVKNKITELEVAEKRENTLKKEFEGLQKQAVNLEEYKQQLIDINNTFGEMLRRLPKKTEISGLLNDISQTGLSSGVEFQLFKPLAERHIEFYAELPIQMRMTGTYHEFGNFVSEVAALPRIVTLHNIKISPDNVSGLLVMEVTAKTYRYLDDDEISAQTQLNKKKKKKGKK